MNAPRTVAIAALAVVAAACTVGPDFRSPDPPTVDRFVPGAAPSGPGMPKLVADRDIPAEWWALFGSQEIDALVRRALANSPTLDEARARLTQAQELRVARTGETRLPQFDAAFGAQRQRIDPATFGFPEAPNPGPFNVFTLGVSVSYNFDLFGGTRRELEALGAEVDYRDYELQAARLALAGNVVGTAIRLASLDAQIAVVVAILAAQRHQLGIIEDRYAAGGVAWFEVQSQRSLVAQTDASLPPLRAQLAQTGHLLAILMGEPPAATLLPAVRLSELSLPSELPARIPSEWVRQRPDIRASEALLWKASANVGVAAADLYPKLVISGNLSSSQLNIVDVLGNGFNIWNIGANLLQPLFRYDELQARKRAAEAAYQQALAGYRQTVLLGLGNVADVLRALESDGQALAARTEQSARADDVFRIALARYNAGGVSQLVVLDADRQRMQAEVERIQASAARYADAAALLQAMGGGWKP